MARLWRTTIAIRIPSGRRANSSSSVTGLPLIIEKKIILIRVSIKKRKLVPHQLINFVNVSRRHFALTGIMKKVCL